MFCMYQSGEKFQHFFLKIQFVASFLQVWLLQFVSTKQQCWWLVAGGTPPRNGNTMRLNLCKLAENLLLNIERECANNCGRGNYMMEAASCTLHSYYWKRTIPCFQIHTSATRAQRLNKKVPSFPGDNQIQKNVKRIFPELFDR